MNIQKTFYYFAFLLFFCKQSFGENLTIDQYISQVKGENLNIEKTQKSTESYDLLKKKAELVNAIKLYGFSEFIKSEPNRALQFVRFDSLINQNNRIGISQTSKYGFITNFYYSLNSTRYSNFNPSFNTNSLAGHNYQVVPVVEINLSLWQNFLGKNTQAKINNIFYENLAKNYFAKALTLQELINAEKSFWVMVYAQKTYEIKKRALIGTEKILNYIAKKARMNLAEKSDVLQAKADVESKKLSLNQAENFLKISARDFNKRRNINSDKIDEKLEEFDINKLINLKYKTSKQSDRLDIKSDQANLESLIALAKIEEDNNKPALNLYASYSVNQVEAKRNLAINNSFDRNAPNSKIGVEFSMPLNFGLSSAIRKGSSIKASSDKIAMREKLFQQEIDWTNLQQNLHDYQENLKLAKQIEEIQKVKFENEFKLLSQGRTSTYQILAFGQELLNAELNTQNLAQKFNELIIELKLYQSENNL